MNIDEMLGDCFAALGTEVPYRPAGGGNATTITVAPAAADRVTPFGPSRVKSPGAVFEVRVSELPEPVDGSEIDYAGKTFRIKGSRLKDNERLIWLLDCYQV